MLLKSWSLIATVGSWTDFFFFFIQRLHTKHFLLWFSYNMCIYNLCEKIKISRASSTCSKEGQATPWLSFNWKNCTWRFNSHPLLMHHMKWLCKISVLWFLCVQLTMYIKIITFVFVREGRSVCFTSYWCNTEAEVFVSVCVYIICFDLKTFFSYDLSLYGALKRLQQWYSAMITVQQCSVDGREISPLLASWSESLESHLTSVSCEASLSLWHGNIVIAGSQVSCSHAVNIWWKFLHSYTCFSLTLQNC